MERTARRIRNRGPKSTADSVAPGSDPVGQRRAGLPAAARLAGRPATGGGTCARGEHEGDRHPERQCPVPTPGQETEVLKGGGTGAVGASAYRTPRLSKQLDCSEALEEAAQHGFR